MSFLFLEIEDIIYEEGRIHSNRPNPIKLMRGLQQGPERDPRVLHDGLVQHEGLELQRKHNSDIIHNTDIYQFAER